MKCYNCGKEISLEFVFCPQCQTQLLPTEELLKQAIANDQTAIEKLYHMAYSSVYYTAHSLIKDSDILLDIVQDSFIKGFRNLSQLKDPKRYRAWMKRIAHNHAIDYLRKVKPTVFSSMVSTDSEEMLDFKDERTTSLPEAVADQKETARLMTEILDSLSEDQRLVIGMYYYEQMSIREIAHDLNCSENTVKSRLSYGRKKIELQVKELEKKGTKLYGLAPIPFLLWLFKTTDVQAAPTLAKEFFQILNSSDLSDTANVISEINNVQSTSSTIKTGSSIAKRFATKSISTKIIAGIAATTIVGGGIIAGSTIIRQQSNDDTNTQNTEQPIKPQENSEPPVQEQTYNWILEPQIEADDIYYIRDFNVENKSLNELNLQLMGDYAVFKQEETLGLIDMSGNKKNIKGCETIYSFGGNLMLSSSQGLYTLNANQIVEGYGRGYGYSAYFTDNNQLNSYWSFEEDFGILNETRFTSEISIPVFESFSANKWYSPEEIMKPPYAIYSNGQLATDFIYEECGTESDGLLAVKQNGKWGYVNPEGNVVIPIEYDASWNYYSEDLFGYITKEYCYAATEGYIPLYKENQWELRDTSGNIIIPTGVFEAIRPVYEGKCWVKQNGKWGVIQVDEDENKTQVEDTSIFSSMPQEGIFTSGAGGWATWMNLTSDGTFTGTYQDSDLGDVGDSYPHGTTYICNFNGKFSTPQKMDDYTYRINLEKLTEDGINGDEYIENGIRYIHSSAYGLDCEEGEEFLIYTPGKPISELPESFLIWASALSPIEGSTLNCYGIYNERMETAFIFR